MADKNPRSTSLDSVLHPSTLERGQLWTDSQTGIAPRGFDFFKRVGNNSSPTGSLSVHNSGDKYAVDCVFLPGFVFVIVVVVHDKTLSWMVGISHHDRD